MGNSSCCKANHIEEGVSLGQNRSDKNLRENQGGFRNKSHLFASIDININEELIKKHGPSATDATQIKQMPTVNNPGIAHANKIKGEFRFEMDDPDDSGLPFLPPQELDNGVVFEGQWKNGLRHGRGIQTWENSSIYYGYWKNGMANGFGRLVHSDGDVYEGEWKNDKAHGQGEYLHLDGAIYRGEWKDDRKALKKSD